MFPALGVKRFFLSLIFCFISPLRIVSHSCTAAFEFFIEIRAFFVIFIIGVVLVLLLPLDLLLEVEFDL